MIKHNQDGAVNGLVLALIAAVTFLVIALGFGGWAFTSRQDYKDNSDAKAAKASELAVAESSRKKDLAFAEEQKSPLKTYKGPEAYGSLNLQFPKTWSGYVNATRGGSPIIDGYFMPDIVPAINDDDMSFALRVQLTEQSYAEALNAYSSQASNGDVTVAAYALPKLPNIVGVKVTGLLSEKKKVTMVVLPLRSQTLRIWTEGDTYLNDFNTYILPNFSFSP